MFRVKQIARSLLFAKTPSTAALQSLGTKLLVVALNAYCSITVARSLHPAGRGEMAAIIMWPGLLSTLLTLGLPSSLIFNLRRSPAEQRILLGSAFVLAAVISVGVAIIGIEVVPRWLSQYPVSDIRCAQWFLLSSPIPIFLLVCRYSLEAHNRFTESNTSLWLAPCITAICLSLLAIFQKLTPVSGGVAYLGANVPVLIWLLRAVYKRYRPIIALNRKIYTDLFGYGLRSWGIDLLSALAGQADQVFVVRFLTPKDLGTYAVVTGLARLFGIFESSASMVLFPRIAAKEPNEVLSITGQVLRVTLTCTLVFALPAAMLGPFLLSHIYGAEYAREGAAIFRILLANIVIYGATQILSQSFMALSRPGIVTVIQAIGLTIIVPLMAILVPAYGIRGAAVAMFCSTGIRFACTLLCYRPLLRINPPAIMPGVEDIALIRSRLGDLIFPGHLREPIKTH